MSQDLLYKQQMMKAHCLSGGQLRPRARVCSSPASAAHTGAGWAAGSDGVKTTCPAAGGLSPALAAVIAALVAALLTTLVVVAVMKFACGDNRVEESKREA